MEKETLALEVSEKQKLAEAFAGARNYLQALPRDPDFEKYCYDHQVQPDSFGKLSYWQAVAEFTSKNIDSAEHLTAYQKDVYEIAAMTPEFVLRSYRIARFGKDNYPQSKSDKRAQCYFGNIVKDFAAQDTKKSASGLKSQLLQTVVSTISQEYDWVNPTANRELGAIIRGRQHELGVKQMLLSQGAKLEKTTISDDLKGKDEISWLPGLERPVAIDIKASLKEVLEESHTATNVPYKVRSDGIITIYSMLQDQDFNDTFEVSDQVIADRAPVFVDFLRQAATGRRLQAPLRMLK